MPKKKQSANVQKIYPYFKKQYYEVYRSELKDELQFKSIMEVPRIEKVSLNMGVGDAIQNKNYLTQAIDELSAIAGQRAVRTKARKSESAFKIREGMEIGVRVTLRGDHMYDFIYRLVHVVMPRTKDFRGINPNAFDGHGNYSLGIREHIVFPEIDYDKIDRITGLTVTIGTTARNDESARALLQKFSFPFRKIGT